MLLEKLNKKIKHSMLDSMQEAEVQKIVGNINYRLNKYKDAISALCKYLDFYITAHQATINRTHVMENVLKTLISIAYCHEKINTNDSISKAITLLERVKASEEIDISSIDMQNKRKLESKVTIDLSKCSEDIETEIFHALSHFYNERAVFHRSAQYEQDILIARKYISIAKSRDKENAFHACHGLICHEDANYRFAITLYIEALEMESIKKDECLKNELLFYLAQSEYAIGYQKQANKHLSEFIEYCNKTNNEDALTHARIMQLKSELSRFDIFGHIDPSYFQEKLHYISGKKPSLYIPVSIQYEWKKLIYAINVFYYAYRIFRREVELSIGIEEVVYNLQGYSYKDKELNIPNHLSVPEEMIKINIRKRNPKNQDSLYFINYKGVRLLCYGDYFSLPRGTDKCANPLGQISYDFESDIVKQLASNNRPDVLIFTPSEDFTKQNGRTDLLRSLINTKMCIVANGINASKIANSCNPEQKSIVHLAETTNMLLQLGFIFFVYEVLRNDLATPTPLLGLAPLGESKSYSYQVGEKTNFLLIPRLREANEISETKPIKRTLVSIDKTRIEMQQSMCSIIDYQIVIEHSRHALKNMNSISLIAFFPNPNNHPGDNTKYTSPYIIEDSALIGDVKYVPPFRKGNVYSYPPENRMAYKRDYDNLFVYINGSQFCRRCDNEEDNICDKARISANTTCLTTNSEETDAVLGLLRHIFPIYELAFEYHCLWKKVSIENGSTGMLLVIVKTSDDDVNEYFHKICKITKTLVFETPDKLSYSVFVRKSPVKPELSLQKENKPQVIPKSETVGKFSKEMVDFLRLEFLTLETECQQLITYWKGQEDIVNKGKQGEYPSIRIRKLLKIKLVINELKDLWDLSPPIYPNTKEELIAYLEQDNHYCKVKSTLKECQYS